MLFTMTAKNTIHNHRKRYVDAIVGGVNGVLLI